MKIIDESILRILEKENLLLVSRERSHMCDVVFLYLVFLVMDVHDGLSNH